MVVRVEVVRERLAALRETLLELERLRALDLGERVHEWAVERGLQIAAQSVFDIGNHVLAGALGARVEDYAGIPGALASHGVISAELEQRLRGLAGFRNILVHDYLRLDLARVRELLDTRLPDLAAFADAVDAWLAATAKGE